jgi:hypothetical protein
MRTVIDGLAYPTIAAALGLAVWGGVVAALGRAPDRALFAGTAAVGGLVLVEGIIAVVRLVAGADVAAGLFIGYLLTAVLLLPAAIALARMEPTRWGSVILAAGGLVLAPLVLRLIQIWGAGG